MPWVLVKRNDREGEIVWMRLWKRADGSKFLSEGPVVWRPTRWLPSLTTGTTTVRISTHFAMSQVAL